MCSKMQVYGTPLLKKVEVQACGEQYYVHSNEHVYTHTHPQTHRDRTPPLPNCDWKWGKNGLMEISITKN